MYKIIKRSFSKFFKTNNKISSRLKKNLPSIRK